MIFGIFKELSEGERRDVLALGRRRRFGRNEVVCRAGDPEESLYLVERGHLTVTASLPSGDTAIVNVLGPGDSFGELALLLSDSIRTATVTSIESAETLTISASVFRELCRRRPEVQRTLSAMLAARVQELSQRLLETTHVTLDLRVFRRLVELAGNYANGSEAPVVPLTQSQLAELTGGTRPTINQILQKLTDQGIVEVARGRVVVHDLGELRRRARLVAEESA